MRKASLLLAVIAGLVLTGESVAAIAPAGPRLAFVRQSYPHGAIGGPFFDLLTAGPFGETRQLLTGTSVPGGVQPSAVAWSPDGGTLAVGAISEFGGSGDPLVDQAFDLFLIGADGAGLRQVTNLGDAAAPVFSVDGKTLYFSRLGSGRGLRNFESSIWAIGIDGSGLRQLTQSHKLVFEGPTSVSPGGDELAFTRSRCDQMFRCRSNARALSLATGNERLLAKRAGDPVYSPDGTRIAIASYRDHNGEIRTGEDETAPATELYVQMAATGHMRRLTKTRDLAEGSASWDPSGQRIAFARAGFDFSSWILETNSDGSCKKILLPKHGRRRRAGGHDFGSPAWQPGPGREAGPLAC